MHLCELCWATWTGRCPINNCPREAQVPPPAAAGGVRLLPRAWPAPAEPRPGPTLAERYGDGTLGDLI